MRAPGNPHGDSSGGPWFVGLDAKGVGPQMSVNSYGYRGQSSLQGPILTSGRANLLTAATDATGNQKIVTQP